MLKLEVWGTYAGRPAAPQDTRMHPAVCHSGHPALHLSRAELK